MKKQMIEAVNLGRWFGENKLSMVDFKTISKIATLARRHHKIQEMDCNGEGWIRDWFYTTQDIKYAALKYPHRRACMRSANLTEDETIFDRESKKLEEKIEILTDYMNLQLKDNDAFKVKFQGDPRGATVRLGFRGRWIDLDLF